MWSLSKQWNECWQLFLALTSQLSKLLLDKLINSLSCSLFASSFLHFFFLLLSTSKRSEWNLTTHIHTHTHACVSFSFFFFTSFSVPFWLNVYTKISDSFAHHLQVSCRFMYYQHIKYVYFFSIATFDFGRASMLRVTKRVGKRWRQYYESHLPTFQWFTVLISFFGFANFNEK